VADVFKERREKYSRALSEGADFSVKAINDFREMLSDPGLDALFILTPDHWHGPGALLALSAGKHVYVEKPLTHNPREAELLIAAQKKYGGIVQTGTQQRSQHTARTIIGQIHDGIIGEVHTVIAFYSNSRGTIGNGTIVHVPEGFDWDIFQGPAPHVAYKDIYFDYNWHWFWLWGTGETGNNATHELDIARWVLREDYPQEIYTNGGKFYYIEDDWSMYDTLDATFKFPGNKMVRWDGKSRSGYSAYGKGRGNIIFGSEGTVILDRQGYCLYDLSGKVIQSEQEKSVSVTTDMGGGGGIDTHHVLNFLQSIRGKEKPNAPAEEGSRSTLMCHLANISIRTGKTILSDPRTGHLLQEELMKKYWGRDYEPGWEPIV
jgi:predicted dehydrogenase